MTVFINRLDGSGLSEKIFVGDLDTALLVRFFNTASNAYNPIADHVPPVLDISGFTELTGIIIRIEKPGDVAGDDPIVTTVGATFATATVPALPGWAGDGTDGYAEFRTTSGFLDRPGR